ncbi:MAG: PAS domain S-box protein [Calditrichaeota bacterium]|nr:MAG: PAS domain S-box protein [Calditrichota bacterium]
MEDLNKSKKQLIDELNMVRSRLNKIETEKGKQAFFPSEERFHELVENAPIGIYCNDFKGTFIYGNKKAEEIIGYPADKVLGKNMLKLDLVRGKELAKAAKILAKNVSGRPSGPDLFTLHREDGRKRKVEIYSELMKMGNKKVVVGMVQDITEKENAFSSLKENESKYRAVIEQSRDCIFLVDLKTQNILDANPAFLNALDYTIDEIKSMTLFDIVDDDKKNIDANIKLIKKRKGLAISERFYRKKDGSQITVDVSMSLITYCGQKVMSVVMQDITEKKKKESELAEQEKRYSFLFDQSHDSIFLIDIASMKIVQANPASHCLTGYEKGELVGRSCLQLLTDDKSVLEKSIQKLIREKCHFSGDKELRKKDGTLIPVDVSINLISTHGNAMISMICKDLSERKKAALAAKKSSKMLRTILDHIAAPISVIDIETKEFIFANNQLKNIFGEVNGKKCYEICANSEYPCPQLKGPPLNGSTLENGKILCWEHYCELHEKWFLKSATAISWLDGRQVVLEVSTDITDRKSIEMELQHSEKSYRGLFDDASDAIYVQNRKGQFLDVNKGAEKMYGYPRELLIGKTPDFVSAPDKNDLDKIKTHIQNAFAGHAQVFEFWGKDKNGRVFPKEVRLSKGTYFGEDVVIAFARDITKKLRYELARRQNEARLQALYEYAPIGIVHSDPVHYKIFSANKNFCKFIGYTKEELEKLSFLDFTHPDDLADDNKFMNELISGKIKTFSHEKRYIKKDGSLVWGKITVSLIHDEKIQPLYVIAAVDDITQQKEAEIEKQNLQERLRQTQKLDALATLAGGIAHDFNNALSAVVGNIELLAIQMPDDATIQQCTQPVLQSTSRMAQLTNQLLAYARGGKYQPKAIEIDTFIRDNFSLLKHTAPPDADILLDLNCKNHKVMADSTQLHMLFSAVISNSAEAINESGKICLQTAIKDFTNDSQSNYPEMKPANYICIRIIDNGCGMDKCTQDRIFEPFFTTKFRGRGLGMAAVYGIVKNHDGFVYVDSKIGKGTAVNIFLPIIPNAVEEKEKPELRTKTGAGTVLVIEDEAIVKNVISSMLRRLEYHVLTVKNGREAQEICQSLGDQINVILLDMGLPDMPGEFLFPLLKENCPDSKIIICSGYSIDGPAQNLLEKGADAFLQKPFNLAVLSDVLAKVMN